jgi:hypothetical protein
MVSVSKTSLASLLLLGASIIALTLACHKTAPPREANSEIEIGQTGEPEQYSATVVRTVDDGTNQQTSITREARSGEKQRQEWTEQGRNRALIWRPDLGKAFLIDLDERVYVEIEINHAQEPEGADSLVEAVDRALDDGPLPANVETRVLPSETVAGYQCSVIEQRSIFPDGHTEITNTFRARDLGGLAVRIETHTDNGALRVTTERRDIVSEVSPAAFVVPSDFKKVEHFK